MEDKELEKIMRRKMLEYMRRIERQRKLEEEKKRLRERREQIIKEVLTDNAYAYLLSLREKSRDLSEQIENVILYLVINGLISRKLEKIDLMYIERKLRGETGKIYIKTKEGTFSFEDFLRRKE